VIPNAVVGGALGVAVSSTLFAMAHGQQDPWLFADRFAFGAVAALLVWRTGGLEASIALHAVNNLAVLGITIAQGELADAITGTEADPVSVVLDVGTLVVTALVVVLFARRGRIVRLFVPPSPPPAHPQWPQHPWPPPCTGSPTSSS
jgi:membrane protease YdiL (CAAX protease family)